MHHISRLVATSFLPLAVIACNQQQAGSESAEDYAARIDSRGGAQPSAAASPSSATAASDREVPNAEPVVGAARGGPSRLADSTSCGAAAARSHVGQPMTTELKQELAGYTPMGGALLVMGPNDMVKVDSNPQRLIVELDSAGRVARVDCG